MALRFTLCLMLVAGTACAQRSLRSPATLARVNQGSLNCSGVNDSSLKAYWKLDESSGNASDSKGINHLTDNNAVGTGTGKIGSARLFNPAGNTYFSIADNADLSTGDIDFTIAAWVNFGGTITAGQYPTIVGKWPGGGESEYLLQLDGDTSRFEFFVSSDGTAQQVIAADALGVPVVSTWYYIVAWHDASANTLNIQVNDGTVNSVSYSAGVRNGTGAFQLGAFNASGVWNGYLDEVLFTKRVLTAAEKTALYSYGGCRPSGL